MAQRDVSAEAGGKPISDKLLRDFVHWIKEEYRRRESNRRDLEERWAEVDQQIAMIYDTRVSQDGTPAEDTDWIHELDLPLQAQGVEVLVTDARNLLFADGGSWFRCRAALTDKYLRRFEANGAIIAGDETGIPTRLTQAGADAITRAALTYAHRSYDLKSRWDICNAEAFKYGTFAIRSVLARLDLQDDATYGDEAGRLMPVQLPVSIKNLFLDDATMFATHEGHVLRPGHIRRYWQKLVDLRIAAQLGGPEAGWNLAGVERLRARQEAAKGGDPKKAEQDRDSVLLLEWEGDLTHVVGDESIYAPNIIVTVGVMGSDAEPVRVRENPMPFPSYTIGHYQKDDPTSPYGVAPLMKGVPIQKAASQTLNDFLQAADLRARPPMSYNPNDPWIAKFGAPRMEPGASFPALSEPKMYEVGDPSELLQGFEALVKLHENYTGVNQVRLGAQTKSHQSAFAVQQEQIRGQVRTVDYVRALMEGPMLEALNKDFRLLKLALKGKKRLIWVDDYKGHVEIDADHLPDQVTIEVVGASGPQEQAAENQQFFAMAKALVEIEPMVRQLGGKPLDLDKIRQEALRRGNIEDVASFFGAAPAAQPNPAPGVAAAPGTPGVPAGAPGRPPLSAAAGAPAPGAGAAPNSVVPLRR